MAAAPARPILAAQGAQGSAGACGGALSLPGLCPRIWKRRSCSKDEGGRLGGGGVPRDQITAPRGERLGGRIPLPSSPLPQSVPCLATITDTPTLGTPSGSPPHWQAPAPPRHPPQEPPLSVITLTGINSQTLCACFMPAWDTGGHRQGPHAGGGRMPTRTQISAVISEGAKCTEQNKPVMGARAPGGGQALEVAEHQGPTGEQRHLWGWSWSQWCGRL